MNFECSPFYLYIFFLEEYISFMTICPAKRFDLSSIMQIERASFIPNIQESENIFEQRLQIFPEGFFVLIDSSDETVFKHGKSFVAGYFCSELLQSIPNSDDFFSLDHSPDKTHSTNGNTLYVSSFAIHPEYRNKKIGKSFFYNSLKSICTSNKQISKVLLLVNQEWQNAKHIYESLGFKDLRIIKNFFPSLHNNFSDGIIMTANSSLFIEHNPFSA